MKGVLTKKRRCVAENANGDQCSSYRLSAEGVEKMLAEGISLRPDPGLYCNFHARTNRLAMQRLGGQRSHRKPVPDEPQPDPMPKEIAYAGYRLIERLLESKLDGTNESDARRVAVGCYLAAAMYTAPESSAKILWELAPRDLRARTDLVELAEAELRDTIYELDDDEQKRAWALLNNAA